MIRNKKLLASVVGALLLASCGESGESASGDTSQERVKNAALTTVAPSCKSGGECRVGDTGPGGGTVFYVGTEKINSYGDKYPGGRYMEFLDSKENAATTFLCSSNIAGTATGVGTGAKNTSVLKEKCPSKLQSRPINVAYSPADNGISNEMSDWFLPSNDELNLICRFSRGQSTATNEKCNAKLTPIAGYNFTTPQWSSSVFGAQLQHVVPFKEGGATTGNKSNDKYRFLLVRAFG